MSPYLCPFLVELNCWLCVYSNCGQSAVVSKNSRSAPGYSMVFQDIGTLRLVLRTRPRSKIDLENTP